MSTLICGSLAYDTIMVFPDRFKAHILPEQIHILNVSFLVPEMRKNFGGTAGNIAYSLKLLGGNPKIVATVGSDADLYLSRLTQLGIDTQLIRTVEECFTAQAFITTDQDDNQITAFHPGAMNFSHVNRLLDLPEMPINCAIVSPDGREGMLQHAAALAERGVPFIFDPGQGIPMFNGEELLNFMQLADYACLNDYEAKMVCEKTGRSLAQLADMVDAMIVTLGGKGAHIYTAGDRLDIPAVAPRAIVDPTGCGDAFRAGLLFGIAQQFDWQTTGRLASLLGSIKIASSGAQEHHFTPASIAADYFAAFSTPFPPKSNG